MVATGRHQEDEALPRSSDSPQRLRVIGPAAATFVAFLAFAVANAPLLAAGMTGSPAQRALVHVFDVLGFVAVGCASALLVRLWQVVPWRRRGLAVAGLWLFAGLLGAWLLPDDLEHFSLRRAFGLPPTLTVVALVLVLSAVVPIAFVAGRASRRRPVLRAVAIATALLGFIANTRWSPGDYRGVHLFAGLGLATLAASALSGAPVLLARLPALTRAAKLGLGLIGFVLAMVVAPPARVAAELRNSSGSIFVPMLNAMRAQVRIGPATAVAEGDWFRSRAKAPSVPAFARPRPENPVVVLITVDALRADVINSGQHDERFPNFARIRKESVWFSQARSAGTLTKVAMTSLFASSYFSQQRWAPTRGEAAHTPSGDTSARFPELLQKALVHTANVRSIGWLHNGSGILRGFAEEPEFEGRGYLASATVFPSLLTVVSDVGERAGFVFSHLSDPHAPYTLAGKAASEFEGYLREVALVDRQLGRLLEVIDAPPFRDRATLIISADHGEAFGEHNSRTHGHTLYDEVLRVPLLVRLPARTERRVDELVSLIDLGPTILDWMGLSTPGTFMGQSLTGFFRGETPVLTRVVAAETRLMQTVIDRNLIKVIRDPRHGTVELYDLNTDPGELSNLADDAARLEKPLARLTKFFDVHRLQADGYTPPLVR